MHQCQVERIVLCVVACALSVRAAEPNAEGNLEPAQGSVRVAAVQCYSRMGEIQHNRSVLTKLIRQAAEQGARIVVVPECAVSGYMDPGHDVVWTAAAKADEDEISVHGAAETIPGPSTTYFAEVSRKHGIHLCLALIEKSGEEFFNSQVLLDPSGKTIAHHRKRNLWPPGDGTWATEGHRPVQVVETPYGRLGLMICYDMHVLPELLAKHETDIVLYSVGWYGPNAENWYKNVFPRDYVKPNRFSIVVANWSAEPDNPGWPGHGYSCIVNRDGRVLAMAKSTRGPEIVIADLPCGREGKSGLSLDRPPEQR